MPNSGDFDPAEAIRQQRAAEEAEKQQWDLLHANILKLLRHADKELEDIRNPIVSEFVVTEVWTTTERISDRREPEDFRRRLRADQAIIARENNSSLFRSRFIYTVATRHKREQARYYGSWLSLRNTRGSMSGDNTREGMVKLRQPRAGYAYVQAYGWDPRNVDPIEYIQTYESLEEVAKHIFDGQARLAAAVRRHKVDVRYIGGLPK